ncbi:MAG: ABC transporter permease subunit [Oscillospiraceae bacterium]|nr:ABC transporter permease subunit [Oscillospiraceae bacterium]MBR0452157.1 ABC transporter permease subunit [Oscillospiraceae bacterium]
MSNENANSSRKEFFLFRWIRRVLFPNKELDIYAEEQLQSPLRMVVRNFFSKPLSVICLFLLIAIMLFVFIAPNYVTLDLGEQDSTLVNIAPGYDMMNLPSELENNGVKDIGVGNNYSVGVDLQGKVYTWGKTKISKVVDVANVPEEVKRAVIVKVAAGADHVVALDDKGVVYAWGNARLGQTRLPQDLLANNVQHTSNIIDLQASNQFSAALTDDKKLFVWGNTNFVDLDVRKELQGHIVDMALTNTAFVVLLDDGSVVNPGFVSSSTITKIPEEATSDVLNIVASTNTVAAIKKDGSVIVWGAATKGENKPPHFDAPVDYIEGGRYHFAAHLTDGNVICWGSDRYGQCDVPEEVKNAHIVSLNSGSFQNYAVDDKGKVYSWGLKGFIMGTDNLGRDVFARLVNGGKMTMTIGALSVVIEMIIGVILGGIAGYFGGWVDMVIMRVAEVISSMPFIPFAMILSAVMGTRVSVGQRMYIIMVILGILSWPGLCRLVRAQMLSQREMEYVVAAKTMGVKERQIIFKHIIPNVMSVCLVSITLAFGTSMLTESTLSYLGFGVPLPTPTWGNMLNGANNSVTIQNYWWNWVFVGAIFGLSCICINLIGDGLRDALDPKSSGR